MSRVDGPVVLAAPDKFRGTATAQQVVDAVAAAVRTVGGRTVAMPLADGGEGTLDAFGGPNRWTTVVGPSGRAVRAPWRLDGASGLAVVEMALASGLLLAGGAEGNDAVKATTRGTGELIVAARQAGARRIIVGLGGSATTDGGFGAMQVMLDDPAWAPDAPGSGRPEVVVCCDVRTTFIDAARVFGPQKGASPQMVVTLTERLERLARCYQARYHVDVLRQPGTGAAGGLAGGLLALGAELQPGFDAVAEAKGLERRGTTENCITSFVHSIGGYAWGIDSATFLTTKLKKGDHVVALRTAPGVDVFEQRWEAAQKIFGDAGLKVTDHITGADPAKIKSDMADELASGEVDGVWVDLGDQAVPAIESFQDAGQDIPAVTGEDNLAYLRAWDKLGFEGFAPVYSNYQWRTALLAVADLFQGKEIPKDWVLPQKPIKQDELSQVLAVNTKMPDVHSARCGCEDMATFPQPWVSRKLP